MNKSEKPEKEHKKVVQLLSEAILNDGGLKGLNALKFQISASLPVSQVICTIGPSGKKEFKPIYSQKYQKIIDSVNTLIQHRVDEITRAYTPK